jgi:hypothetical protein
MEIKQSIRRRGVGWRVNEFLAWVGSNNAANTGLSTITSLISVIAVVIAVYQYYTSAAERELQTDLAIWADLTNNTGEKDAIQLLAMHGVSMNSIRIDKADLSRVNIPGANISYADVEDANLTNADLTNVEFAGSTLNADDFSFADLTGADLNHLNLNKPIHNDNFSGAILPQNADLKALAAIACVGVSRKTHQVIWPVMDGQPLTTWPLDATGAPQPCTPPKAWQASCARVWCRTDTWSKLTYALRYQLPDSLFKTLHLP